MPNIVLIAGFETFNEALYRQVVEQAIQCCPDLEIYVFRDRNITQ